MARRKRSVIGAIRAALRRRNRRESLADIGHETRIHYAHLSRFARDKGGLGLEAIDRLAAYLNLEIVERRNGKGE